MGCIGRVVGLALVVVGMAGAPVWADPAASFDCTKAHTPTEQAICKDESLAWLDSQLNRLYGDVRQLQGDAVRATLRDEQRAWVGQRDACAAAAPCIAQRYWQRLKALAKQSAPQGSATGSFTYVEKGMAGSLALIEFPAHRVAGWIETINVSRGHMCQVDMADLRIDGQTLTWTDPEEIDGKHCRVDISTGPGGAVVTAQDCRNGCGMAGFFEGHYQRQ